MNSAKKFVSKLRIASPRRQFASGTAKEAEKDFIPVCTKKTRLSSTKAIAFCFVLTIA
jgi:hypothetical protein